jgi:ABC-2 type transport system ATP-binding protein
VRQTLVRLKAEGKTIFLNSHLLQEVELVCDRVAILDRGLLKGMGRVEELVPHHGEGIELQVSVIGSAQAMHAAMAGLPEARIQSADAEHHLIQVCLHNQGEVDRYVDALRRQSLSIASLGRRRITLEEAFMEVLGLNADKP